jgi:hypothetical protein
MPFNIGSQQGGVINNVEGNQTIYGDQTGSIDPRLLLDRVRHEVAALRLPESVDTRVRAELDRFDAELAEPESNRQAAVGWLGRAIATLKSAGALTGAGSGLLSSLTALVHSFGPLGEQVGHLLGAG